MIGTGKATPNGGDPLLKRAAEWAALLQSDSVDEQTRADFNEWVNAAPEHRHAFETVRHAWNLAGALPEEESRRLRAEAYGFWNRSTRRRARAGFFAAGIAAAILVMAVIVPGSVSTFIEDIGGEHTVQMFRTAIGERSTVTLADGSLAMLNTNTRLEVDFTEAKRHVRLIAGQALFEVKKDKARPFVVSAGERTITALGTAFDVRLEKGRVQVTLIEGRVSVELAESADSGDAAKANAELSPGQQLTATGVRPGTVRRARLDQVTSWREGRLIFEDEQLADAVAEVNRYSTRRLVLQDPTLRKLRISGVFRTGQPQSFVQALTAYFPIRARSSPSGDAILLTRRR